MPDVIATRTPQALHQRPPPSPPRGKHWELASWDAVETAARIAGEEITPREVVEAALARAEDVASLGAVVTSTAERALTSVAGATGPLAGVPTFIKDLTRVGGVRFTCGTRALEGVIARRDDAVVGVLERCGLVSLGKSATPELGILPTTEPLAFGPCHNPWDPSRTPGGSSGGAAALVAAGVVPIAHGSDGGGSLRIPGACCGLVALKPSRFRLDMEGSALLPVNVASHGVLTRSVRDTVAFWAAVEAQQRPRGVAPLGQVGPEPRRRLKVRAFTAHPLGDQVDPQVASAVERTVSMLRLLGHEVIEGPCPFTVRELADFLGFWAFLAWLQLRSGRVSLDWRFDASQVEPFTAELARYFSRRGRGSFEELRRLRRFRARYAELMAGADALLCPTVAQLPPRLHELSGDQPFEVLMPRLIAFAPFTGMFNTAGAPALSLPLAHSSSGLPIGVQLAAAHGDDALLLELGLELEQAMPWRKLPRLAA